jgi:hypothetical protein
MKDITYAGLDVQKTTVCVAGAETGLSCCRRSVTDRYPVMPILCR